MLVKSGILKRINIFIFKIECIRVIVQKQQKDRKAVLLGMRVITSAIPSNRKCLSLQVRMEREDKMSESASESGQ